MNPRFLVPVLGIVLTLSISAQTTRLVPSQYPTIQAAINASINGDTVLVAPGGYSGTVNYSGKTLTVTSSGGSGVTTLFGVAGAAVVTFQGGEGPATALQGFRITAGGPGVYCHNASPQISNCVIEFNFAPSGAGAAAGGIRTTIDAGTGSPTITNCKIANNSGYRGGGLSFETSGSGTSSPTIIGCTVSGNNAFQEGGNSGSGAGGGFYILNAVQAAIITTSITDNITTGQSGGVYGAGTSLLVDRCRIIENRGSSAAALSSGGACTIVGTLIASNVMIASGCVNCGQAPIELSGTPVIQSCTITGNVNPFNITGGVAVQGGSLTLASSIVWGNTGIDLFRQTNASITPSYSNIGTSNFAFTSPNFSADPLFIDAAGGDFHLASASPCRDAGSPNPGGLPPTDIDGLPRIAGPLVDVGVDEIPIFARPGTPEGLDLYALVNHAGDPLASTRSAVAGNPLTVLMKSSAASLVGGNPLFAAELYSNTSPPMTTPPISLDGLFFIVYGALSPAPFTVPGLPPDGLEFNFTVPSGLTGMTLRMQAFVQSMNAINGMFAASNATEVTF